MGRNQRNIGFEVGEVELQDFIFLCEFWLGFDGGAEGEPV
jgi:hypothetical protein